MAGLPNPDKAGPAVVTVAACRTMELPRSSATSGRKAAAMSAAAHFTEPVLAGESTELLDIPAMAARNAIMAALPATETHRRAMAAARWAFRGALIMAAEARALWEVAILRVGSDPGVADHTARQALPATGQTAVRNVILAEARVKATGAQATPWEAREVIATPTTSTPATSNCAADSRTKTTAAIGTASNFIFETKKGLQPVVPFSFIWQSAVWHPPQFALT